MGVYELARAAASRCAARIEELPVFRLAWSERGAPRVILPVFRLAWSERGAPRRSCAAGGAPGAGCARCVYEAAACGGCRRGSRAPKEWSSVHCSVHVSTRRACVPSVRMQCYAAVPAFPKAVAIEPRDSQGRLSSRLPRTPWDGWGGLKMSNLYVPRRWNSLLAPRSSKGRYRSPTGPLVVPVSMKTVRPRAPPGNAGPARPHGAPPSPRLPLRRRSMRCMRTPFADEGDLRRGPRYYVALRVSKTRFTV